MYGDSSYITKYLRISSYVRKPFLTFDFATAPIWISLYMRKFFSFLSVYDRKGSEVVWGSGHWPNILLQSSKRTTKYYRLNIKNMIFLAKLWTERSCSQIQKLSYIIKLLIGRTLFLHRQNLCRIGRQFPSWVDNTKVWGKRFGLADCLLIHG